MSTMHRPALALLTLLLTGCGTNALRIEYATDVVSKARTTVEVYNQYLMKVNERRIALNIEIISLDPACIPNEIIYKNPANIALLEKSLEKNKDAYPRGWLCETADEKIRSSQNKMSIAPVGNEVYPTLLLLKSISSYAAGIAKIIDGKAPDPLKDINEALALARSAEKLLSNLTSVPTLIPAGNDKRLSAVGAFIKLLSGLADEQKKVEDLQKYLKENAISKGIIVNLQDHLETWTGLLKSDQNLQSGLSTVLVGVFQRVDPPLPIARRREMAARYYETKAETSNIDIVHAAVDAALTELSKTDENFQRIMEESPKLTEEEKRRKLEIERKRIGEIFDGITNILISFKGA